MGKPATKECSKCHHRFPVTEMSMKTETVKTGHSGFSWSMGQKSKSIRTNSGRSYYRKKDVWTCNECSGVNAKWRNKIEAEAEQRKKLELDKAEKERKAELDKAEKERKAELYKVEKELKNDIKILKLELSSSKNSEINKKEKFLKIKEKEKELKSLNETKTPKWSIFLSISIALLVWYFVSKHK
jgi:DNA-binding transcriptional regulator GbsR (MarR family)